MRAKEFINESANKYKEIEFVCVNPQFPDATDPILQRQMYLELKKINGVIPLWQEWGDYSEGQASLSAIYKDPKTKQQILALAKTLKVNVDLIQPVSDDYVDRAIRGEHDGQLHEANSYQPPELNVGDKILKGKFKNSPAEIKGFTTDQHNQPVLKTNKGSVPLFKPRVAKLMNKQESDK